MSHKPKDFRTASPKDMLATLRTLDNYCVSGRLFLTPETMVENDDRIATLKGMLYALGVISAGDSKRKQQLYLTLWISWC